MAKVNASEIPLEQAVFQDMSALMQNTAWMAAGKYAGTPAESFARAMVKAVCVNFDAFITDYQTCTGLLQQAWELLKEAYGMPDTDAEWDRLVEKEEQFAMGYTDPWIRNLASDVMIALTSHIEDVKLAARTCRKEA